MEDLQAQLGAIMNDPAMMEKLMAMAQNFSAPAPPTQPEQQPPFDPAMLQKSAALWDRPESTPIRRGCCLPFVHTSAATGSTSWKKQCGLRSWQSWQPGFLILFKKVLSCITVMCHNPMAHTEKTLYRNGSHHSHRPVTCHHHRRQLPHPDPVLLRKSR